MLNFLFAVIVFFVMGGITSAVTGGWLPFSPLFALGVAIIVSICFYGWITKARS